jgi:hypothetical protein
MNFLWLFSVVGIKKKRRSRKAAAEEGRPLGEDKTNPLLFHLLFLLLQSAAVTFGVVVVV